VALMDRQRTQRCAHSRESTVSNNYAFLLAFCGLFLMDVTVAQADTQLPAITVTGKVTPTPPPPRDAVDRDWIQRSPDIHWPTPMFNKSAEIFTHNEIEINAPCATVWNHLVQAQQWPSWCRYARQVTIWGGSPVLQKNSKFTWVAYDLPQDNIAIFGVPNDRQDSLVVEYVPLRRIGWRTFGRAWSLHGSLCDCYQNWLLKPVGDKKCRVTFEEVATGMAARYARGAYPEIVHLCHDHWLEGLKWISEAHR
jgi:Polyketide cyclase / dehydrase and lipid transport